jgi:RHS repeat-associated protein
LVVGGSPTEREQVAAQTASTLMSPEAVSVREESQTKYEGLNSEQAERVDAEAFPELVEHPDGGPPRLPEGEQIIGFPSDFAASLALPEGRHGAVESAAPMAVDTPSGRVPVNLTPRQIGAGFEATTPPHGLHVMLGGRLGEGASLSDLGVTLTPVTEAGTSLERTGRIDGASVFYGDSENAQAGVIDTDTLIKPQTDGFSEDTILRSERAPSRLFFKVGLPEGASLSQEGSGTVAVMDAGRQIAGIILPSARDAEGTVVPVSMSVQGNILTLTVEHHTGQYRMPIAVDPTAIDHTMTVGEPFENNNWAFSTNNSNAFALIKESFAFTIWDGLFSYTASQYGYVVYPTQGASHIYEATGTTKEEDPKSIGSAIYIASPGKGKEGNEVVLPTTGEQSDTACTLWPSCESGKVESVNRENRAFYEVHAIESATSQYFDNRLSKTAVYILQEQGPSTKFDTSDPTVEGKVNAAYPGWVNATAASSAVIALTAFDPGIGISHVRLSSPNKPGWVVNPEGKCAGVQCEECYETECATKAHGKPWFMSFEAIGKYVGIGELPEGEDTVEEKVEDATGLNATASTTVKVDDAPPHNIALSGLGPGGQIGPGEYTLKAEATDGSGTTPSSGVKSMALFIDGREVGSPSGSCPLGPCTAHSGTWTIFGHSYATGRHSIKVYATDNVGNTSSESFTMTVHPASPVALGPGALNPQSGEFSLGTTDVSMGGGLTVSRSYGSQHLTAGAGGPLGAQWAVAMGGQESLLKQPDGSMVLTGGSGAQTIFAPDGKGGYISPAGDSNLGLSSTPCEAGQSEVMLKNAAAATTTCFKVPSGGTGETWTPRIVKGAVATDTVTYSYESKEVPTGSGHKVTRPNEALAPVPTGVSCSPTLNAGCRALTFNYASSTTAKGEAPAEWGDIEGQLTRVYLTAYDPVTKTMKEKVEVAHYLYDKQGRLRVLWDPQAGELKTYYGYDSEGHLTAITPPGQETLAFVYGAISGSATPAVLKATPAPNSAPLWKGESPVNTEAPNVTGAHVVGGRMAVTEGKWSGSPVVYGYQWEDCNPGGGECVPIPGATNANYTPTVADEGHKVAAVVTATNGAGSVALTAYESTVSPTYSSSFGSYGTGNGQLREPEGGLATDAAGNVWVSDTYNNRLEEFNSQGESIRTVGSYGTGAGQFGWTLGVTVDSKGNVWATDEGNNRVEEFTSEGVFVKMFGWGVSNGEAKLEICTSSCRAGLQGSGNGEFYVPEGIAVDAKGNIFVADRGNHRVQEFNSEDAFVRSIARSGEEEGPFYLNLDSAGNLWVAYSWDKQNQIAEFTGEGTLIRNWGTTGSEKGQLKDPYGVAVGAEGNVWVSEYGNNRVQVFTPTGESLYMFGSKGNGPGQFQYSPHGLAFYGSNVYVLDSGIFWENTGNSRIEKWVMPKEGEARPFQPGSTVEYNVPVSGGAAPHAMGAKEVEEGWAQKDIPAEATAVFPADEPQGWPASDYKRATIYYRDGTERTVNVATPSGGIATSEYNANNDVERTLSPGNRAAALKEAKPAEVSKLLDTQSEYNSEGTELLATLGPRHTLKLANGKEVQARSHTVYRYDEGAPAEGGPYRLVTKTTQGAKIEGEAEQDIRTTVTSYSAQNGLGWKLRKPTAITTDPGGLNLTRTTVYDEATGNVTETGTPAANPAPLPPTYSSSFGSYGTGNGQLREPEGGLATDAAGNVWVSDTYNNRLEEFNSQGESIRTVGSYGTGAGQFGWTLGVTVDSKGNVWATDEGNNRVEEFTSEGVFVKMFGWGVSNGEAKLEICTSSCRAGLQGSGNGEFYVPEGIAVDAKGNIFVADRGNHRVQEFNSEDAFVRSIARSGEEEGPFYLNLDSAGNLWVAYSWDKQNQIAEFTGEGTLIRNWGTTGSEKGQLKDPYGVAVGAEGNVWVSEYGNNRVQVFTPTGESLYMFGSKGNGPGQFQYSPHGLAFYGSNVYVLDSGIFWENTGNSRIEKWVMPTVAKAGVHDTQTIYYTTAANTKYPACGEHPEWANRPCQTQPAEQPNTSGLPNLPVTTVTYNMYGEPTKTTSTVTECVKVSPGTGKYTNSTCTSLGSGEYETRTNTRTNTVIYDEAGRPTSSETTSTAGAALPKVTDKYSPATGALIEQSTSSESLKSEFNNLGQLTSYTDADGTVSSYEYESEKGYRLTKLSDGKGTQTYEYDATTGAVKALVDSAAGTFTAAYDVEGNRTSEGYPNAMSANITLNAAGQATGVQYVKTAHCAKTCPETWYSDTVVPSIHGQWMTQQSNQAAQTYTYDGAGRLTQTLDNVVGTGCVTHIYTYDEETNRLSLTARPPGTGGVCASEGGSVESHTYDPANRLTDAGTTYDPFGNTASLPAADAGGSELTSTFYQDNRLATAEQNKQTIGYQLDPAGRTREIVSTGKIVASEIQHYAGPGNSTPAWTGELSTNYTRYITGIGGTLAAVQHSSEAPTLQLSNLHGDIVATAYLSETATALASTVGEASEYGVPATEAPPKFSWLGAHEIPTSLPSGMSAMGARSYVPQLGRFLQRDPRAGGSANAYAYTYGDPVNSNDLTGEYSATIDEFDERTVGENSAAAVALRIAEIRAAEEAAARAEAEQKAAAAAAQAAAYAAMLAATSPYGQSYGEDWGEEEWGEEEWGEEEVAYHPGEGKQANPLVEEGLLFHTESEENSGADKHEVRVCVQHSKADRHPCIKYVSIFSKAWHWVKKHAARLVRTTAKVVLAGGIYAASAAAAVGTYFLTAACLTANAGVEGLHCYHILLAGSAASTAGFVAGTAILSSALHEWF